MTNPKGTDTRVSFRPANPGEWERAKEEAGTYYFDGNTFDRRWEKKIHGRPFPQLRRYYPWDALRWLHGNGLTVGAWLRMSEEERRAAKRNGSPLPDQPWWWRQLPVQPKKR
ncbi:MAG: hypothetical protein AAF194_07305 [Pseudomonadota bacterium]